MSQNFETRIIAQKKILASIGLFDSLNYLFNTTKRKLVVTVDFVSVDLYSYPRKFYPLICLFLSFFSSLQRLCFHKQPTA